MSGPPPPPKNMTQRELREMIRNIHRDGRGRWDSYYDAVSGFDWNNTWCPKCRGVLYSARESVKISGSEHVRVKTRDRHLISSGVFRREKVGSDDKEGDYDDYA
jgi:hypothetical protein